MKRRSNDSPNPLSLCSFPKLKRQKIPSTTVIVMKSNASELMNLSCTLVSQEAKKRVQGSRQKLPTRSRRSESLSSDQEYRMRAVRKRQLDIEERTEKTDNNPRAKTKYEARINLLFFVTPHDPSAENGTTPAVINPRKT